MTRQFDSEEYDIDRRTILKSAAAASAVGLVGVPTLSASAAASSHTASMTVRSDTSTQVVGYRAGDDPSTFPASNPDEDADLTWVHSRWESNLDHDFDTDTQWIWHCDENSETGQTVGGNPTFYVQEPTYGDVVRFEKDFTIPGTPTSATLYVTADNGYEARINGGTPVSSGTVTDSGGTDWEDSDLGEDFVNGDPGTWDTVEETDVVDDLIKGSNTLTILGANEQQSEADGEAQGTVTSNPGGVIFELDVEYDVCEELDLCAGQDTDVGTVTVSESEGSLSISYDLDEPWLLCESHVDIGDEKDDLHTNRPGNPTVGKFDLSRSYDPCVSSDTFTVDCDHDALSDVEDTDTIYIAVHGVVVNPDEYTSENLVTNGGFEDPEVGDEYHWDVFGASTTPTLPGWNVEWTGTTTSYGGLTRPDPQLEIQEDGINGGWTADEGDQWAELDTDWDGPGGPVSGEPSNVRISQNVSTSGSIYELSYAYSPRPGVENNFLDVYWNGVKVNAHTADGSGNSGTDWTTVTMLVEAESDEAALAFAEKLEETAEADSLGMFLDDVSVREIREETAWVCGDQDGVTRFEDRGNWATYFEYESCGLLDCSESAQ